MMKYAPRYYERPAPRWYAPILRREEPLMTLTIMNILTGDGWKQQVTQAEGNKLISWIAQTNSPLHVRCTLKEMDAA